MHTSFSVPKGIEQKKIGIILIDFNFTKKKTTTYEVFVYQNPFNIYNYKNIEEASISALCKKDLTKEDAFSYVDFLQEHFEVTEFDDYTG